MFNGRGCLDAIQQSLVLLLGASCLLLGCLPEPWLQPWQSRVALPENGRECREAEVRSKETADMAMHAFIHAFPSDAEPDAPDPVHIPNQFICLSH